MSNKLTAGPTLALTEQLIRCGSVTPTDAGCQQILGTRLRALGFQLEPMRFGAVQNINQGTIKPPDRNCKQKVAQVLAMDSSLLEKEDYKNLRKNRAGND